MPLFGPSPYVALIAAYEKLLATERAARADAEDRWNKERKGLLEQLMVLTNPAAVRTANSTIRQVGVIRDAPPDFNVGRGELPEDFFEDPSMPTVPRPRSVGAVIRDVSRIDSERVRAAAEKRRDAQAASEIPVPAEAKS